MKNNEALKKEITEKIQSIKTYLSADAAEKLADRLLAADESLQPNLLEWLNGDSLSNIWIRDKYCIGAVMKIRGDNDFVSAFLALNDYVADEAAEAFLWQQRK